MKSKKFLILAISAVLIVVGCIGTFANEPGIYMAIFMIGIVVLIVGSSIKSK